MIPAIAAALLLTAGVVSAQTSGNGGVNVSVTPTSSTITPGTGVTLGTVQFTGDAAGASLTGFPITIGATGSGSVSNLSNCSLVNSNGTSVTGNVNPSAGSNAFGFNSALNVSSGVGTTTLSLRCDVASNTPAGTAFQLTAGTPTFATGLRVNLDTAPTVPAGSTNVALANILLDSTRSGGAVSVSAIPVSITAGGGASNANLSNCRIRPSLTTDGALSGGIAVGSMQTVALNSAFVSAAGTRTSLAIACDVAAGTPVGSTFTIAITPSAVTATNTGTGASITPTAGNSSGTVIVTATVSGGGDTDGDTGTPGVPNTGLGGNAAMTLGVLLFAALMALGGSYMLRRA